MEDEVAMRYWVNNKDEEETRPSLVLGRKSCVVKRREVDDSLPLMYPECSRSHAEKIWSYWAFSSRETAQPGRAGWYC